jgi:hypothetical protein
MRADRPLRDQEQIGSHLLHQIELMFGAVEIARAERLRHALEIAERLEREQLQPEVSNHPADLGRKCGEAEEVSLKNLDTVEFGLGDSPQLVVQRTAERETVAIDVFIGSASEVQEIAGRVQARVCADVLIASITASVRMASSADTVGAAVPSITSQK